jgi:hypothetical protein
MEQDANSGPTEHKAGVLNMLCMSFLLTFIHFLQESSRPPCARVMEPDIQEGSER